MMESIDSTPEIKDKIISMNGEGITLKKLFGGTEMLRYADIAHAYLRVEEVNAKMCCGRANFDLIYLMLSDGKEVQPRKVQITTMEKGRAMLGRIRQRNPGAKIGFKGDRSSDPETAI